MFIDKYTPSRAKNVGFDWLHRNTVTSDLFVQRNSVDSCNRENDDRWIIGSFRRIIRLFIVVLSLSWFTPSVDPAVRLNTHVLALFQI